MIVSPSGQLRWVFLGQNTMGGAALRVLLERVKRPELVITRLPKAHHNDVESSASRGEVELVCTPTVTSTEMQAMLARRDLDVGVCAGWFQQLPQSVLDLPRLGWINLHPSPLPAWRGSDPIGWQLATGVAGLGCTVHEMTVDVDAGRLIASASAVLQGSIDGRTARVVCGALLGRLAADTLAYVSARGCFAWIEATLDIPTTCPPRGVVPLLMPAQLTVSRAAAIIRAFAPYPGVAIDGLPTRQRACEVVSNTEELNDGTLEPSAQGSDGLTARIRFRDGWLVVRLADIGD